MIRLGIYTAGLIISLVVSLYVDERSAAFAIAAGLAVGFVIPLIDATITNFRTLRIASYALRTWRRHIRVSVSYLFRIKVDNEYLLVKGKRFDHYQPVGGVYKTHLSSSGQRNRMGILDDELLLPDKVSEGDLRVRVPGKSLVEFVRWFETGQGRETDCWREFFEELVATGILSKRSFRFIKYDHLKRRYSPMRFSRWAKSQELFISDVVELLPTEEQLSELRALRSRPDARILWATEDQIRRLGVSSGLSDQTTRIAETATWTIDTMR